MTSAFDIDSLISEINHTALFPRKQEPVIGITGNFADDRLQLLPGYFRSIEAAGGLPVVIPPRKDLNTNLVDLLDRVDGLLLSGGADLNPLFVGEDPVPALSSINPVRDSFELALIRLAYNRQIPMLGICRGIQMLAAALGGTIRQDIAASQPASVPLIKHSQDAPRGVATHYVEAEADSEVARLLGTRFAVNSFHHQAVGEAGERLRVTARSADGVVEAVESTEEKPIIGIQWHPECFLAEGDKGMLPLFTDLVGKASLYRAARNVHSRILTLDSHCDTPMCFHQGVELTRRDPKLLVDFPKMREGGLDATIMVAYLPQGERDDSSLKAATTQAEDILKEIRARVEVAPRVELACTPADLYRNKAQGVLSVMQGIENGYALGRDVTNIERFARLGVVYITLCHNGDNDICDSACRSKNEHNGLSDFGKQVVREMNRCGLMVDLSHAAESSFYDALAASQTPIVCSHASSRALCNHPRNLTDDQLRALSRAGGVAQVTLYHGFLRLEAEGTEATLADGVKHLLHMIDVAGIDHVGIGTDFDGDGGVKGCACASELICFTERLLAEGLTQDDLEKIWGGNFLRVMSQCQAASRL